MSDIKLKGWSGAERKYEGVPKVWLSDPESTDDNPILVPFTYGEAAKKTVVPDFSGGDMDVPIADGELVTELTINQPVNLKPENIPKGMYIAGVGPGEFEGGDSDGPQLFAPSNARISTSNGLKYIYTGSDSDNGGFTRNAQVISKDSKLVLAEGTPKTTSSSQNIYAYNFTARPSVMPFTVGVQMVGENFAPSDPVNINTSLYLVEVQNDLANCGLSRDYPFSFSGDKLAVNLTPNTGYYYPKSLLIEPSEGEIVYTYDPITGAITIPSVPQVDHIRLSAEAPDMPWLQNPILEYDNKSLAVNFLDDSADSTPVIHDGNVLFELEDGRTGYLSHSVETIGSYGFTLQSNGYYADASGGSTYRVALCKVTINMKTAGMVNFSIINYGYNSYDYGIIGKVDAVLSSSYSTDIDTSSSNVYTTYKSNNSTSAKTVSMSVPAGEHFIYFKYRRYYQSSSSYYFMFKVTSVAATPSKYAIADYVEDYGEYNLTVQSIAEGYTPSDVLHYMYIHAPDISVDNNTLVIKNLNSKVEQVSISVDGEHLTTLDYDGSADEITHDLTQYAFSIDRHAIYVDAILDTGETCRSNILEDAPLFVYSPFSSASWEEISKVARAGLAQKCYKTSDTKTLTYNGSMSITVSPAGFNHDDKADGSGKANLSIISLNVPAETVSSLPTSSTMLGKLPAELRSLVCPILKEVDVNFTAGDLSTKMETCSVFVPSITELGVAIRDVASSTSNSSYISELGTCYEKYAVTKCDPRKANSSGTTVNWLTRNKWHGGTTYYVYGNPTSNNFGFGSPSGKSYAFGFCLG